MVRSNGMVSNIIISVLITLLAAIALVCVWRQGGPKSQPLEIMRKDALVWKVKIPDSYKPGSDLEVHFHVQRDGDELILGGADMYYEIDNEN